MQLMMAALKIIFCPCGYNRGTTDELPEDSGCPSCYGFRQYILSCQGAVSNRYKGLVPCPVYALGCTLYFDGNESHAKLS